jgi:glycosyltransferase involved in cell wall biosynthesis
VNILQVIPYFVPAWDYGGPVQAAYNISKELVRRGHEVTVYTTDTLSANSRVGENEEVTDGIRVRRFKNPNNWLAARHHLFLPPSSIKALRDNLTDFDVIHLHEYWALWNVAVQHYARKYHIPYLVQAHGTLRPMMAKQNLKKLYNILCGYNLLRNASKVIALTQAEAEHYKRIGINEDRIEIVPNGIDLSEYSNLPPKGGFRQKYGIGEDEKVILYLGRIHQGKGIDLLAEATASITKKLDAVKLAIVGPDDGYLPALEKLIAELGIGNRLLITGPLYGQDKLRAYVDADVYVLPSISEGFPISVFESCACGSPVIITDRCTIGDLIHGQAGIVISYDKEQLVGALSSMLSDDKMRQDFGDRGRLLAHKRFSWGKIAGQV